MGRKLKVSLNEYELREDCVKLKSLRAIGKKYGIDKSTVKCYLNKYEIPLPKKPRYKYSCNDNLFKTITPKSLYLAGFIAADGCVMEKNNGRTKMLQISLSKRDEFFLNILKNELGSDCPINSYLDRKSIKNPNYKDVCKSRFSIVSGEIFNDLSKFNIKPRKSLVYKMPNWLVKHSLVHHFIRGYVDGDGSFYESKNQVCFSLCATKEMLEQCNFLLKNNCKIEAKATILPNGNMFQVKYHGNSLVKKIHQYLYKDADIFLHRKRVKAEMSYK